MSITSLIKNAGVFPYAKKIIIHRANLQLQKYFCEELLKLLSNDETISVTRRTTRPLIRKLISTKKLKKHNNGSVAEKVPMELSLSLSLLSSTSYVSPFQSTKNLSIFTLKPIGPSDKNQSSRAHLPLLPHRNVKSIYVYKKLSLGRSRKKNKARAHEHRDNITSKTNE